jgi:hypothetical protein
MLGFSTVFAVETPEITPLLCSKHQAEGIAPAVVHMRSWPAKSRWLHDIVPGST